nr:uncharacterized protein LOC127328671 [Lolium perenne]
MVKKRNLTIAASAATSGTAAKATSSAPRKSASEVPAPTPAPPAPEVSAAGPAPGLLAPEHFQDMLDDNLEEKSSSIPVESQKANVQPSNISSGGFADEDDLYDLDEGFIEPPPKKAKTSSSKPTPAASEASAPVTTLAAQLSIASSLSKGKEIPSTTAITASPPPGRPDFRTVIFTLEAFAFQFTSLEAEKVRLQKEVESTSLKLDNAVKMAAEACQNADSLKEELERLRSKLKDEEALKITAEAQRSERDNLLRQSILALLKASDIPAEALDKLPDNSHVDASSMTLESSKLIQALLQKNKEVMSRMHSMIFPKADQNKTLEQLTDAFAVDTKEIIEVFKHTSRTYDTVLAFQLMMGHGFKADMEQMSKELPKEQDGQLIDLSLYKSSARKCALQLLELVSTNKSAASPSLSTQTHAP